jgi:hypothetical protein
LIIPDSANKVSIYGFGVAVAVGVVVGRGIMITGCPPDIPIALIGLGDGVTLGVGDVAVLDGLAVGVGLG